VHGAHHFCTFMAPALIEAAATVSQTSSKNFDYINTHLLEDLANNFARRHRISSTPIVRTLETSSGRSTTQAQNTIIKSQILNTKDSKLDSELEKMNAVEGEEQAIRCDSGMVTSEEDLGQSSELRKLPNGETCALSEAEGGKSGDVEGQHLPKSTPSIKLKERRKANESKLQALERRARILKQRLRTFQTGRLLSHVKTQAQLLDYSHKASRDPRTKPDHKFNNSLHSSPESSKTLILKTRTLDNCVKRSTSNSCLTSILRSEPKVVEDLGHTSQSSNITPAKSVIDDENKLKKVGTQCKQEVFGVLTNSVKDIMSLDDPDATDPESEDDDFLETHSLPTFAESRRISKVQDKKVPFDLVWARDRVKIGSMCTWIQAQIADLSHKIKRYGDLHHHVKTNRQQLVLEENRKQVVSNSEIQQHLEDSFLSKSDLNGDDLQSNIFARLQAHKNGLAKELSAQTGAEFLHEKGVGARTVPVSKLPKHKYVKRSIETAFKGNDISYQCSNLPAPFPCAQCLKAASTGFPKTTENVPAIHLDHSYHQQLSTEYDRSLPLLLESSLRTAKICVDKKNLLPAVSVKSLSYNKDAGSKLSRENVASAASKAAKFRLDKKRNRRMAKQVEEESDKEDSPIPKKKASPPSAASLLQRRANSLRAPSSGSGESRPATPVAEQSFLSSSCPSPMLSQMVKRKSRTSSEYDINNIVIPYSISSSTRLEKPQYKEILTPRWRVIGDELDKMGCIEMESMEDTTDAAYSQRHSRHEASEHHKFTAFFQLPFKRSRSTRKSSECNTPEPYSPSHPDTPVSAHTPSEFVLATPSSAKSIKPPAWTLQSNIDENSVMPWPCRTFPLEGEDLLSLEDMQSVGSSTPVASTSVSFTIGDAESNIHENKTSQKESNPSSLNSSDSELLSPIPEQPMNGNEDEKWTVRLMTEVKSSPVDQGTVRKGIVLKLAKK